MLKILFMGDVMFGRDGTNTNFHKNPWKHIRHIIKDADVLVFNLETVICGPKVIRNMVQEKKFYFRSEGKQLERLREINPKQTIIASIANNHTLDYEREGLIDTMVFLKQNNIHYTLFSPVITDQIVFLNGTDHCGCKSPEEWGRKVPMIDYKNIGPIIEKIVLLKKKHPKKIFIYSCHWGPNYIRDGKIPLRMQCLGKALIDAGVNIVFGHSAHHVPPVAIQSYNLGKIIYGLGDAVNDYAIEESMKSDEALLYSVNFMGTNVVSDRKYKLMRLTSIDYPTSSIPQPVEPQNLR